MTKIICAPASRLPEAIAPNIDYFALYSNPGLPNVGTIAPGWPASLEHQGLSPSIPAWDFISLALAVAAADFSCPRAKSADGWTRMIELDVYLYDPSPWKDQRQSLEEALRFLTGDFWTLNLLPEGEPPPYALIPAHMEADCVSLLSGGVDSLVGAIDLEAKDRKPLFVSQVAENMKIQQKFAKAVGGQERHFQWNHRIKCVHSAEISTRGRSIIFLAFAVLAASTISENHPVEIFVPENGFISLNIALNPGRMGSLSTKTTHPVFLDRIQTIWDAVGINAILKSPYRFLTKGELLSFYADQHKFLRLVGESISCGRFKRKHSHCGRCVPCLVRRAAFQKAGISDPTQYSYANLYNAGRDLGANDIGAVAAAYLHYQTYGIRSFVGGHLSFSSANIRSEYEGVIERGMAELGTLLKTGGVI